MISRLISCAILAVFLSTATAAATDWSRLGVNIYGLSYHLDRRDEDGYRFNELNPGLGLQYLFHARGKSEYTLGAGALLDSYRRRATYLLIGYEYALLRHVGVGLVFGLYDSRAVSESGAVVAAAPMISLRHGRTSLRLFHLPEFPGINPYPSFAISLVVGLGTRPQPR